MQNEISKAGEFFVSFYLGEGLDLYGERIAFEVGETIESLRYKVEMSVVAVFSKLAEKQGIDPNAPGANEIWSPPGDC